MNPRCARRCLRCRGRTGWYLLQVQPGKRVIDFNPTGGYDMLLHFEDGSVGCARYHACRACGRKGVHAGAGESVAGVHAWAERVGFAWPDTPPPGWNHQQAQPSTAGEIGTDFRQRAAAG